MLAARPGGRQRCVTARRNIQSPAVGKQTDHFLESIHLGMKRIHAEMGNFKSKRAEPERP